MDSVCMTTWIADIQTISPRVVEVDDSVVAVVGDQNVVNQYAVEHVGHVAIVLTAIAHLNSDVKVRLNQMVS